jgi:hypothetical protein
MSTSGWTSRSATGTSWRIVDTETCFSIYLPPADLYEGRFFQHLTPVPDSEHLAQGATAEQDRIGFSISSGALARSSYVAWDLAGGPRSGAFLVNRRHNGD